MSKYTNNKGFTLVELMFSTMVFATVLLLSLSALIQIGRMYYKGVTASQTQQTARSFLDEISQAMQFGASGITTPTGLKYDTAANAWAGAALGGPVIAVNGSDVTKDAIGYFCIGSTRYTFALDRMQDISINSSVSRKAIRHAVWADEPGFCNGSDVKSLYGTAGTPAVDLTAVMPTPNGRDMLSDNMRLTRLAIEQPSVAGYANDGSTWIVKLTIAYGDDDLMDVDTTVTPNRRYCKTAQAGTQFCATSELSTIVKKRVQ